MVDPINGPGDTTTCLIRSTATPCLFAATGTVGYRNLRVDRQLRVRHHHHAQPERQQPELLVHADLRGPEPRASGVETTLNVTLTRDRFERQCDDRAVGGGRPTAAHHQVLHLLIERGLVSRKGGPRWPPFPFGEREQQLARFLDHQRKGGAPCG